MSALATGQMWCRGLGVRDCSVHGQNQETMLKQNSSFYCETIKRNWDLWTTTLLLNYIRKKRSMGMLCGRAWKMRCGISFGDIDGLPSRVWTEESDSSFKEDQCSWLEPCSYTILPAYTSIYKWRHTLLKREWSMNNTSYLLTHNSAPVSVSDGCLVVGSHPHVLHAELCGVIRSILISPEEIQSCLSSHKVHQNPCATAVEEICEY